MWKCWKCLWKCKSWFIFEWFCIPSQDVNNIVRIAYSNEKVDKESNIRYLSYYLLIDMEMPKCVGNEGI
jgi:hypothetical protein